MPKLPTYTAPLQGALPIGGGRSATGADFGEQIGAAGTQFGRTVGNAAEDQLVSLEQADQRNLLVAHSELRARYAKALQDAEMSGDPIDPLRQKFEDESNALRNTVTTAAGAATADAHTNNSLAVFDSRAAQISIERAGTEARTGGSKLLANNASLLMTNPAYLPVALAEVDAYADTFAGRLKPAQIAEMKRTLREHLTVATVSGQIMTGDPTAIHDKLVGGEWPEIGPEARTALLGRAMTQERVNRSEADSAERTAAWRRDEDSRLAKDEHFKNIINGQFSPRATLMDQRLTPEHREHLIVFNENWQRQKLGQEKVSDQGVVRSLMLRIWAREGDPNRIYNDDAVYEALKAGKINVTDANRLRIAVANQADAQNSPIGRQFGRTLGMMQKLYSGPLWMGREHIAAEIVNSWAWSVQDAMDQKRQRNEDPRELFNPKSKDYVLSADFIAGFARDALSGKAVASAVPVGHEVQFPDGVTRKYKGGDPMNMDASWEVVKNPTPDQMVLSKSGITVKWNGKGDKHDLANWDPLEPFVPSGNDISRATANYQDWRNEAAKERSEFFNSLFK